uniref:DUF4349 domain-containing protein n=1 Tax=Flavobacterium sp. TaxID=239 RepID=UPI00404B9BF8
MKKRIALLLIGLSFLSCKKEASENFENKEAASYDMVTEEAATFTETNNKITVKSESKIIKTANLRFPSTNLNESYKNIVAAAKKYKATVQSDNSGKDYSSFYRNISIRIPNQYFDAFLNEISNGVAYFDKKEIYSQDVTEQFVDIEARLKAKRTLENRYLQILNKASKVSEILEIEGELATIREEIEAKQGQLQYLQSQVSRSTVSIEMYTENSSGNNATITYASKMGNAIKSGFNGIATFFIGILHIWPFILILAVVFFFIRRKIRKK